MPAHSAQVLGLLSLEDKAPSQFRTYDGKTRKFHRPKKQKPALARRTELLRTQLDPAPTSRNAAPIVFEEDVEEVVPGAGIDVSLIPIGHKTYRQSGYDNWKLKRQNRSPAVSFADPGRQSDPFKVFPIAYQDCVPDACQFC